MGANSKAVSTLPRTHLSVSFRCITNDLKMSWFKRKNNLLSLLVLGVGLTASPKLNHAATLTSPVDQAGRRKMASFAGVMAGMCHSQVALVLLHVSSKLQVG